MSASHPDHPLTRRLTSDDGQLTVTLRLEPSALADVPVPALILLDGERFLDVAVMMRDRLQHRREKTRIAPLLLIGLDTPQPRDQAYVLSPRDDETATSPVLGHQMLEILSRQVLPIAIEAGADPARISLFGHSLSGLFALHARAHGLPLARYGVVSPSLWWPQPPEPAPTLHPLRLYAGSCEEGGPRQMLDRIRAFAEAAKAPLAILPDEDHGSAPLSALPAILRFASED